MNKRHIWKPEEVAVLQAAMDRAAARRKVGGEAGRKMGGEAGRKVGGGARQKVGRAGGRGALIAL